MEICGAGLGFRAEEQILEMKVMEECVHRVTTETKRMKETGHERSWDKGFQVKE